MDFDSLTKIGAMIGSGGLVVMDEEYLYGRSCKILYELYAERKLWKMCSMQRRNEAYAGDSGTYRCRRRKKGDIEELEELADMIENTALCGLGKSAPKPVISTIHAFREEYEEHIVIRNVVPVSVQISVSYKINPEKCKGCSKCAKKLSGWCHYRQD